MQNYPFLVAALLFAPLIIATALGAGPIHSLSGAVGAEESRTDFDALFLQGCIYHRNHEFDDALRAAERLVAARAHPADYGLLGDACFDLGNLESAAAAYQEMIDLRPGLDSYIRAAEIRWITGDLPGAIEAATLAVQAGSRRQPEPLAWAYTRLARFLHEDGQLTLAHSSASRALLIVSNYVSALTAKGEILMAEKRYKEALPLLEQAAAAEPFPSRQWPLWECYRALGRGEETVRIEGLLLRNGAASDPRTLSLFLATCGENQGFAVDLARLEIHERQDVFTHDALAWSLFRLASHDPAVFAEARRHAAAATASGANHPRIHFHAGLIARASGDERAATGHLGRARAAQTLLLPSEQRLLEVASGQLTASSQTESCHP